jgi:hypothetical protein
VNRAIEVSSLVPRLLSVFVISLITISFVSVSAFGQQDATSGDQLSPQFTAMTKEVSLGCSLLLPGNVPGIPNMMDLCGGRYAFKVAPAGMLEAQLMGGHGSGQTFYLGSFSYRGDMSLNDLIVSVYGGLDLYDLSYNPDTVWYGGIHFGGAIWWDITDTFFLRTDLELLVNPGTSMLILLSAVLRFDAGGGGGP